MVESDVPKSSPITNMPIMNVSTERRFLSESFTNLRMIE